MPGRGRAFCFPRQTPRLPRRKAKHARTSISASIGGSPSPWKAISVSGARRGAPGGAILQRMKPHQTQSGHGPDARSKPPTLARLCSSRMAPMTPLAQPPSSTRIAGQRSPPCPRQPPRFPASSPPLQHKQKCPAEELWSSRHGIPALLASPHPRRGRRATRDEGGKGLLGHVARLAATSPAQGDACPFAAGRFGRQARRCSESPSRFGRVSVVASPEPA
jgi:hypothetical protein